MKSKKMFWRNHTAQSVSVTFFDHGQKIVTVCGVVYNKEHDVLFFTTEQVHLVDKYFPPKSTVFTRSFGLGNIFHASEKRGIQIQY